MPPFWARRYTPIVVSDEEAAQVERFRYILSYGVKENLVERVLDWPGVHAARSILEDKPLTGSGLTGLRSTLLETEVRSMTA